MKLSRCVPFFALSDQMHPVTHTQPIEITNAIYTSRRLIALFACAHMFSRLPCRCEHVPMYGTAFVCNDGRRFLLGRGWMAFVVNTQPACQTDTCLSNRAQKPSAAASRSAPHRSKRVRDDSSEKASNPGSLRHWKTCVCVRACTLASERN